MESLAVTDAGADELMGEGGPEEGEGLLGSGGYICRQALVQVA